MLYRPILPTFVLAFLVLGNSSAFPQQKIRVGHFPTVTHAPALIAKAQRHFETLFGESTPIEWKVFNAGPLAVEALFAGELDLLYVGPNPAINGFVRSKGDALRIVAGVAKGGSALVVRPKSGIRRLEDLQGKRVATPQIGNTQDVAFRSLLREKGLAPRSHRGNVDIYNMAGGDQLVVLAKGDVDAVWTVEPWVSRAVAEAKGEILFEEKELCTTLLVVQKKFMEEHPDLVRKWVKGHRDLLEWIRKNPAEAKQIFNEELKREIGTPLAPDYLEQSFNRIVFTDDPMESSVKKLAERAFALGYLGRKPLDLSNLYEFSFLEATKGGGDS